MKSKLREALRDYKMNKKIISILLLAIMFMGPFAFAGSVGGLGIITGKFSYGGVEYIAKDADTIVRTIDGVSREYTKNEDGVWGFIGATSGNWIPINNPVSDPNWNIFQGLANEATVGFVAPVVNTNTVATNLPVLTSSGISAWQGFSIFEGEAGKQLASGTYTGASGGSALTYLDKNNVEQTLNLLKGQTATVVENAGGGYDIITATVGDTAGETITGATNLGVEKGSKILGANPEGGSMLSNLLGAGGGSVADALLSGTQWAAIGFMAGQMIGPMIGFSETNTDALSVALSAGLGVHKMFAVGSKTAGTWLANPLVGVGIGALVFLATYRAENTDVVEFECMPWQAPSGGEDCELCNDGDLPCSEYRCRSLGQNCEIVNSGTEDEKCVAISRNDVSPPIIRPNEEMLTLEYSYTNVKSSPPGPGFEIVSDNTDGCLKAFSPLAFGINIDEPAQCKIDFSHTASCDEMSSYMGDSNLYLYNHSEKFSLPSVTILEESAVTMENGKDLTFFIRCKDKSGNENSAEYAVRFCVDPTPDTTAPSIEASSIVNGGCVAEDQTEAEVEFYTNEPAECRWSQYDQDYDSMQEDMVRSGLSQINSLQLFSHTANLNGIGRENTEFYIRCKDLPDEDDSDRNKMRESFKFILQGSNSLKTKNLAPSETIFGGISPMPVELHVETLFGCNNGQAVCSYSSSYDEEGKNYVVFFDTNSVDGVHTQKLNLGDGSHEYFVRCIDEGGNLVRDVIEFELDINTDGPVIARIYEEAEMLKVVTARESDCSYSLDNCDFSFEEGTMMPYANSVVHLIEWDNSKTFYIKCRDEFRDVGAACSAIVRPMRNF